MGILREGLRSNKMIPQQKPEYAPPEQWNCEKTDRKNWHPRAYHRCLCGSSVFRFRGDCNKYEQKITAVRG